MHIKNPCRWYTAIGILMGYSMICGVNAAELNVVTNHLGTTGKVGGYSNIARPKTVDTHPHSSPRLLRDYQQAIDRIEAEQGAYSNQMPEYLLGLGLAYQNQGAHSDAIDAFKRAMHLSRINEGLYSLSQVPVLERLIESHVARGQWQEANNRHHYLYWLHRRNFGATDPRMLPIIDKLSNWHLNAYALDMGSGLYYHLINAHKLFNLAVNIIDSNYGKNDLRLIEALRGLTVSNYYLATYKKEAQPTFEFKTSTDAPSAEQKARLEQYISNSYNSGKRAINRMVGIYANNPDSPPWAKAKAKVELGDWHLLFNKWQSAMNIYQESHDFLVANNVGADQINSLFGQPVALPDLPLMDSGVTEEVEGEEQRYVLVSFDVTPYGRASKINILESNPKNSVRYRARVRKALKEAKFRPRFESGVPAPTENLTHRYLFANE